MGDATPAIQCWRGCSATAGDRTPCWTGARASAARRMRLFDNALYAPDERTQIARLIGFDAAFYRTAYPDVAEAGVDPLAHFPPAGRGGSQAADAARGRRGHSRAIARTGRHSWLRSGVLRGHLSRHRIGPAAAFLGSRDARAAAAVPAGREPRRRTDDLGRAGSPRHRARVFAGAATLVRPRAVARRGGGVAGSGPAARRAQPALSQQFLAGGRGRAARRGTLRRCRLLLQFLLQLLRADGVVGQRRGRRDRDMPRRRHVRRPVALCPAGRCRIADRRGAPGWRGATGAATSGRRCRRRAGAVLPQSGRGGHGAGRHRAPGAGVRNACGRRDDRRQQPDPAARPSRPVRLPRRRLERSAGTAMSGVGPRRRRHLRRPLAGRRT